MNCENFIKFSKTFRAFEWASEHYPQAIISLQESGIAFRRSIKESIAECKVFEIDDNLKKLLCLTDPPNKNDDIQLPFPIMFLDIEFTREELANLGIDIDAVHIVGVMVKKGILVTNDENIVGHDLNITTSSLQANNEYWFDTFNKNMSIDIKLGNFEWSVKENPTTDKKAREFVHKFVINFINFLNNPEIEIVEHKRSHESQERRKRKGLPIIPTSMKIRIYGRLKEYYDRTVAGEHFHYSHAFWVRGHFRTLQANRYKDKKRIWIMPFVKGDGILIDKTYSVKEKTK